MTELLEAKIITKVNSRGEKRKRVKCKPGFKLNGQGNGCVPISGREKASKKVAIRKALRSKRAQGQALKVRTNRKRLKALKKRKAFGLK